jgi:hypothetical protein
VSSFSYGNIALVPVRTLGYRRQVIMDGPAYLYTRHVIHVQGLYHPGYTSYTFEGRQDNILPEVGNNPAYTDGVIRHQLKQPRQKLLYTQAIAANFDLTPNVNADGFGDVSGGLVILDAPPSLNPNRPDQTGNPALLKYLTDANNGPFVLYSHVSRIDGSKSWLVELVVQTDVNECFNFYTDPTPLLSHRWACTHDIDRDAFTRRSISGHAIFRTDQMLKLKANVDDYRIGLLHRLPPGFERHRLRWRIHEDGNRVDYELVDQEVSHTITVQDVTHIEGFAMLDVSHPGLEQAVMGWARPFFGGVMNLGNFVGSIESALPVHVIRVVVRVWGNKNAKRVDLTDVAETVLQVKAGRFINRAKYGTKFAWRGDLMGRYVELTATFIAGPITTQWEQIMGTYKDILPTLFADDDIPGVASASAVQGQTWPMGAGTRGTYTGAALAQGLPAPCKTPGAPFEAPAHDEAIPLPD